MFSLRRHSWLGLGIGSQAICALLAGGTAWAQANTVASTSSSVAQNASAQAQNAAPSSSESASANLAGVRRMIARGEYAKALMQIDTLSRTTPEPAGVETARGTALYAQEHLAAADAAFAKALQQNPADAQALQLRGLTLYRLGRPAEAIPLLEHGKGMAEGSKADPAYVLALCYLDTRRYDDARHAFAAQYGFSGDSAAAYLLAARMLLRREYVPIAQQSAQKALALEPGIPLAHALLGEIALASNNTDEAIAQLSAERTRNPLEPRLYDRLGDAYTRAGDYTKAQQALQQAVLLEPDSTGPYILLGKVLLKRNDPATAAGYLEHARGMDPSNYITRSLLGQAYRQMGRTEDARRETEIAQQLQTASTPKLQLDTMEKPRSASPATPESKP